MKVIMKNKSKLEIDNNGTKEWYLNGIEYTEEAFNKKINSKQ